MEVFHSFTLIHRSLEKLCKKKKKSSVQIHIIPWIRRNFWKTIALSLGIALCSIACMARGYELVKSMYRSRCLTWKSFQHSLQNARNAETGVEREVWLSAVVCFPVLLDVPVYQVHLFWGCCHTGTFFPEQIFPLIHTELNIMALGV